ncbi:MAG TPA: competence/damage-inducible protein A [Pyrinomonadaceae bacterium]|nr:competence/damage-inducible protein A [Pyrinomonadaceae bacterium]
MLSAEIIAIGSELLTPEKTDTNSLWLTGKLNEIGIDVKLKTIVGDDSLRLEETIKDAVKRSDVVITTGGLGPTEDDITRTVSAKAIGRELTFHEDIVESLRVRFRAWGREMPEINKRQAYVIEGAEILPNPNGSAVGMLTKIGEKFLIILPGPPRENQPMFETHVFQKLKEKAGEIVFRKRILKVSGLGESAIDEAIAPIYSAYKNVQTGILFNKSEVEVHLTANGKTDREADALNEEIAAKIVEKLGVAVFSTSGEEMEEVVGKLLAKNGKTLSVAESCTGGLISQRLTDISGSSAYFIEGVIAYANEAKTNALNVLPEIIEQHGAVSAETAEAMAKGMRERAKTDYAISITGIAGPTGGTEEKPVGTVFIGYSDENLTKSFKILLPGDRYLIRWRSSQAALDYLRRQILK